MIRTHGITGQYAIWKPQRGEYPVLRLRGHTFRVKSVRVESRKGIRQRFAAGNQDVRQNLNAVIWRRINCEFGIVLFEFLGAWINVVRYSGAAVGKMVEKTVQLDEITGLDGIPNGTRPNP